MSRENTFLRWLVIASLADWLIARSLARMAIFMPKAPVILTAYRGLTWVGQFAAVLCALLGLIGLGWLAWRLWSTSRVVASLALACLGILNIAFILVAPDPTGILVSGLLLLGMVTWFGWVIWRNTHRLDHKIAVMLPVMAIWIGSATHVWQALYAALKLPGPAPLLAPTFNLGELLAVLSPIGLWWIFGRRSPDRQTAFFYLLGMIPAALFLIAHRMNPSMTGILSVWSAGLTLYLPAWLYAISLWLGIVTVFASRQKGNPAGWALILLASAGYAPQLSSQVTLSLIALSLLAGLWAETAAHTLTTPSTDIAYAEKQPQHTQHIRI